MAAPRRRGVRELAAAGMEIGSHSATHVRLAGLDPDQLATEVAASRADLAALLQTEIRGFAFPYGSMDAAARRAVHDAGYAYACAVETPRSELGLMALPRIYVGDRDSAVRMTAKRHLLPGLYRDPRETRMKVLHVITGLDAGGAELQLSMLVRRTRHEADVVTLYNPGPVADRIRSDGISVRNIGMRRNTELPALLRLRRIIRAGRYDVVHAHLYRAQVYARPAARLAGTPVVLTTEHSIGETHIERRKMTAGVRTLYLASEMFSDATIAVSDIVRDRLERWGVTGKKITVVPNGLDVNELAFDPAARDRIRQQFGIPPRHLRDRGAGAPRPEQAHRPDDGGGRAAARRGMQDPGHRPRRGPGPADGSGRPARRDRQRDIRRLPIRHPGDAVRI